MIVKLVVFFKDDYMCYWSDSADKEEVGHLEKQEEEGKAFKGIEVKEEVVVEEDVMKNYVQMIWMLIWRNIMQGNPIELKEWPMFYFLAKHIRGLVMEHCVFCYPYLLGEREWTSLVKLLRFDPWSLGFCCLLIIFLGMKYGLRNRSQNFWH